MLKHFAVAGREHELAFNRVRDYAETSGGHGPAQLLQLGRQEVLQLVPVAASRPSLGSAHAETTPVART